MILQILHDTASNQSGGRTTPAYDRGVSAFERTAMRRREERFVKRSCSFVRWHHDLVGDGTHAFAYAVKTSRCSATKTGCRCLHRAARSASSCRHTIQHRDRELPQHQLGRDGPLVGHTLHEKSDALVAALASKVASQLRVHVASAMAAFAAGTARD